MPRAVHFEIYADKVGRATKFYSDVFGWQVHKWDGPEDYWLVITGAEGEPGIDGAIMGRPQPGATGMNFIDVDSVDEFIAKIQANGGKLVRPKMAIPEVGYAAVCSDTEGNPVGPFQGDPSAA
jgi:predicted enzyme related to lactoylglutathione lyase